MNWKINRRSWQAGFLALSLAVGALGLAGCQTDQPAPTTTAPTLTEPAPAYYQVRYLAWGKELSRETVEAGQLPQALPQVVPGLRALGWENAAGEPVDPEGLAVAADVAYYAAGFPELCNHVPYLFPDDAGMARPDDALTGDALAAALTALAPEAALDYFPGMPVGNGSVSGGTLEKVLSAFFSQEELEAETVLGEKTVTRGAFAGLMNRLLGRGGEETLTADENAAVLPDLNPGRKDAGDLMEALIPHEADPAGQTWTDALLDMAREPGFFNLDGWLYYADEDGAIVRDDWAGKLYFGEDGRYTSGDEELDEIVAGILADILAQRPGAERLDILRGAFEYCRDSFTYLRKDAFGFGDTGWEVECAKEMFTTGYGNCYNYAASFWALAQGLGYEARAISGTMLSDFQPHSWVEIDMDGTPYIFDTEEEMYYRVQQKVFDKDMFMLTYEEGEWWNYIRP